MLKLFLLFFLIFQPIAFAETITVDTDLPINDDMQKKTYNLQNRDLKERILGISLSQWISDLEKFNADYLNNDFIDKVLESEQSLKSRRNAEFFEKVGEQPTGMEKHKDNPLLQIKHKKKTSKFITNVDLSNSDYNKTLSLIPLLSEGYSSDDIAKYLPYIALCINQDIIFNDILYYVQRDVKMKTPIDIACERLYRLSY